MKKELLEKFALEWVEVWNSHDLDKIMAHYADDFEMNSPLIKQVMNIESGKIKGKDNVRAYWKKALAMNPRLHFELIKVYSGANSVVIHYEGPRGLAAEVFFFNNEGKVDFAHAHYE